MSNSDRELLELAAKAAGIKRLKASGPFMDMKNNVMAEWNPLTDDGDALRLAVTLNISPVYFSDVVFAGVGANAVPSAEAVIVDGDKAAATRRAIVRAAAAIGKAMP